MLCLFQGCFGLNFKKWIGLQDLQDCFLEAQLGAVLTGLQNGG